jgi:hypothetical protein
MFTIERPVTHTAETDVNKPTIKENPAKLRATGSDKSNSPVTISPRKNNITVFAGE